MVITLKKVKVVKSLSRETNCFTADIYVDGKKIGSVENRGCGGSHFYRWTNVVEGRRLENWANAQPMEFDFEKLDQLIDGLLMTEETRKQIAKKCKTRTLFRLEGDAKGSWRMMNAPYDARVETWLNEKYGARVEMVANLDVEKACKY